MNERQGYGPTQDECGFLDLALQEELSDDQDFPPILVCGPPPPSSPWTLPSPGSDWGRRSGEGKCSAWGPTVEGLGSTSA